MKRRREKKRYDNTGVALLIVLWVLILLSVIAGEFSYTMRNQVRMVSNFKESAQAYYIAVGGINRAIYNLLLEHELPPGTDLQKAITSGSETLAGQWRVNQTIGPLVFGDNAFLKLYIQNEGGKIDINSADRDMLDLMVNLTTLEGIQKDIIVDSILDWRDENSLHRANGAEDDYYRSLPEPYESRDGRFESKQELLLVRGITSDIYNALEQVVTVLPEDNKKESDMGRLRFMFGNTSGKNGRLNINAIPLRLLGALPDIESEIIDVIAEYRKEQEIQSLSELRPFLNADQFRVISRYLTADQLPYYRIWSKGYTRNQVSETIQVLVRITGGDKQPYKILEWKDAADE